MKLFNIVYNMNRVSYRLKRSEIILISYRKTLTLFSNELQSVLYSRPRLVSFDQAIFDQV
jgi:hypothetical protein